MGITRGDAEKTRCLLSKIQFFHAISNVFHLKLGILCGISVWNLKKENRNGSRYGSRKEEIMGFSSHHKTSNGRRWIRSLVMRTWFLTFVILLNQVKRRVAGSPNALILLQSVRNWRDKFFFEGDTWLTAYLNLRLRLSWRSVPQSHSSFPANCSGPGACSGHPTV